MGWYMDNTILCDEIIEYHKTTPIKYEGTIGDEAGNRVVDKTKKDSTDVILDHSPILMPQYGAWLQKCINAYVSKYEWAGKANFSNHLRQLLKLGFLMH